MEDRKHRGRTGRSSGGRAAKQAKRSAPVTKGVPYITRKVPVYEVLDDEIGVEFRGDAEALQMWKTAGADIDGERVRIPKGLCKKLIQDSAPEEFTQHARNPERNVRIGGKNMVLVPAYGSPFVRDLEKGRRYATLEDFQNFVKLAYSTPYLHHSGGTICEPVDLPALQRQTVHGFGHCTGAGARYSRYGKGFIWRRICAK